MDAPARHRWERERPGQAHPVDAACIAPWVALEFDPRGWVYTCCANQTYPLGRIGDERLGDLWAGERAQVLRDSLRRWDLSVGCASCRWHIEHGRTDTDAAVYDRYPLASADPPGPTAMTFALSNRCNLACVMCNADLSSTIRRRDGLPPLVSPYDDQFFEDLAPLLADLRYAKFLGGEPFLVPEHERVWDLMAQVGAPPRIQVTTNATVWTERVEWVLDTFAVDVTVSIDAATAPVYERIRGGADFARVLANVDRFAEACRSSGTELRFCFCLMTVNHGELADFLSWADRFDAPVSVNVVSDLGLALHDLPADELALVDRRWSADELAGRAPTGRNSGVWATQREQLASVLAERRTGAPPAIRQPQPPRPDLLSSRPSPVGRSTDSTTPADAPTRRARLGAWAGGGEVAEVVVGGDGTVLAVPSPHRRLGLDDRLVGRSVDALLDAMTAADGRQVWVLGEERSGADVVRTLALSDGPPARGLPGTVVRTVAAPVAADGSHVVLVAEDRIHERNGVGPVAAVTPVTPAAVAAPRRRRPS